MYRKIVSALYSLNIVGGGIFSLLTPIGLGLLASYLSVRFLGAAEWCYALLVGLGAVTGIWSMIKYVITAATSLERLEREAERKNESQKSTKKSDGVSDEEK